ncbi:hypothetical protein EG327_002956 [Venturia inaequalis]|uniref:Uncharacterized protein n=1 Tax=Venturia inaequalis TaxID=5025 RepID=A0A8H3VHJ3_VENIN|nr:hypothetical protein EG327_002956 [Venturia inaequalis]
MTYLWTPTLCATATSVALCPLGYALGKQQETEESTAPTLTDGKRRQSRTEAIPPLDSLVMPSRIASPTPTTVTPMSAAEPLPTSGPAPAPAPAHTNKPGATQTLSAAGGDTRTSSTCRPSYDGRILSAKVRRLTTSDAAAQRRTDHERSTTPGSDGGANSTSDPSVSTRLSVKSRSSWMKRLSAMSNTSSTSTSPRPESPTLLPSNASAAISNTGSTVPMVGSAQAAPIAPNKLVKRESSQRLAGDTSRVPTLRRPATSHQRSATLKSLTRNNNTPSEAPFDKPKKSPPSETRWKQFFSVKVGRGGAFSRNSDSPTEPTENSKGIRRVLPDKRYYPTLITAKSVVTSTMDVEDFPDYDEDSLFFGSRPQSALGMESLAIGTPGETSTAADESFSQQAVPSIEHTETDSRRRRSFSLHDLLTLGPSHKSSISRAPSNKLTKRAGRRVVSAPLAATSKHSQHDSDSERPSKRREVTRPSSLNHDSTNTRETELQYSDTPSGTDPLSPGSHFTFTSQTHSTTSKAGDCSPSISHPSSYLGSVKLDQSPHSPVLPQEALRPSNHSAAPSTQTSTLIGSEVDARFTSSANEDDEETNSDSAYDSLRTRGGRNNPGARGARMTQCFDEPPPPRNTRCGLQEILPPGMLSDRDTYWKKSSDIIEEEESNIGTPVRTIRSDKADDGSPATRRLKNRSPLPLSMKLPTSPPNLAKPLSLGTLEYDDPVMEDDEESRWSCFDDEESGSNSELEDWGSVEQIATPLTIRRSNPFLVPASSSSSMITSQPQHVWQDLSDKENRKDNRKSNIFDWSEQPTEKSPGNRTPPRPRTVHGKKDADRRGSRTNKRRAPSGLHVRSQSVPVVPDLAGKRETVITNKFGTWGVGSKGVSEDWDEDFDFGDGMPTAQADRRIDSGVVMHIPQVIREHQAAVVNNIGLVREFGLLIEELKVLRIRASSFGLLETPNTEVWEEIDCMIDLADQEAEDPAIPIPQRSPPSSPGWDMTAFDESFDGPPKDHVTRIAGRTPSGGKNSVTTITPTNSRKVRKSVLPADNDVFSGPLSSTKQAYDTTPVSSVGITRPRKDSEALARSIIETLTLKKRKDAADPMFPLHPVPSSRKVPFDTNTLRHIVPYVHGLVRKVKDQLREAEGFDLSRDSSPDWNDAPVLSRGPPISRMFKDHSPAPDSPSRRARAVRPNTTTSNPNEGHRNLDDLNKQMTQMTVM